MEIEANEGRRIKLELFGENYYLSVFPEDGGWAFMPTVPRENDPMMSRERLAEVIREDTVRERRVTGIGVRNVRARILMAHPGNAFTIYSKENLGTIVRITLYLEEE